MKKNLAFITAFIALSTVSHAQTTYSWVRTTLQSLAYGIGQEWNCPLKQGEYFTKTFSFDEGTEYDIVAMSEDGDVLDVDIEILNSDGSVYKADTKTSALAEVNFTPSYTRSLTIKVKNYRSNTPYYGSRVYFLVAYKD